MTKERLVEILDKHIDQQGLAKDLVLELVKPKIDELKLKIETKEIDPVPGEIDNILMLQAIGAVEKYLGL